MRLIGKIFCYCILFAKEIDFCWCNHYGTMNWDIRRSFLSNDSIRFLFPCGQKSLVFNGSLTYRWQFTKKYFCHSSWDFNFFWLKIFFPNKKKFIIKILCYFSLVCHQLIIDFVVCLSESVILQRKKKSFFPLPH